MNTPTAISKDPANVMPQSTAVQLAALDLIEVMLPHLDPLAERKMTRTLNGGGKVGLEVMSDRFSKSTISLVCIEPEGRRIELAAVTVAESPPKP